MKRSGLAPATAGQHLLLCVGRRAVDPLVVALEDYLGRLASLSPARVRRVRPTTPRAEGAELLSHLPPAAYVTVLEEVGTPHTTASLAALLRAQRTQGRLLLAWVVGGAHGLDEAVRRRAQGSWCLSPLTLPHRLAHVVVAEQLYRAQSLLARRPYHHD